MQDQILLPLDDSVEVTPLLPVAALAYATQSCLHLLYVIDAPYISTPGFVAAIPADQHLTTITQADGYLQIVARSLQSVFPLLAVEMTILEGDQIEQVLVMLKHVPAIRLLALAPRTRSTSYSFLQRNITTTLAQCTSLPLLYLSHYPPLTDLALSPLRSPYRGILVPLFGGDEQHMIEMAATLAAITGAVMALVAIVDDTDYLAGLPRRGWFQRKQRSYLHERLEYTVNAARSHLETVADPLRSQGLCVQVEVTIGRREEEILRLSHLHEFDLIVTTDPQPGGIHGLFSQHKKVLQQLIHMSKAPVLLVRPSLTAQTPFASAHSASSSLKETTHYSVTN